MDRERDTHQETCLPCLFLTSPHRHQQTGDTWTPLSALSSSSFLGKSELETRLHKNLTVSDFQIFWITPQDGACEVLGIHPGAEKRRYENPRKKRVLNYKVYIVMFICFTSRMCLCFVQASIHFKSCLCQSGDPYPPILYW